MPDQAQIRAGAVDNEPLTPSNGHSRRCANPFCSSVFEPQKGKRYCSDRCRFDGHVLKRAKEMLDQVGAAEFNEILTEWKAV